MKKTLKNVILGSLLLGATALGGAGAFYANRAEAANGGENKHVLVASIGYMGGKPGWYLWWKYRDAANTVFLTFNDIESCERARSDFQGNYRDEMFNSVCITMPKNSDIQFIARESR